MVRLATQAYHEMPRYRDRLPDDLKELIGLVRIGKFIAVRKWLREGRRYAVPPGNFITTPFQAAVETGFHSMVEVFLKAGIKQDEKDEAMRRAVWNANLVLIKLLRSHGADPLVVDFEAVIHTENPSIIRWFIARGIDLQEGCPIAYAFRFKHREFLSIYMGLRNSEPTAREQAAMALRLHCVEGNLEWVSLLLEAGAEPRLPARCIHNPDDPDNIGTALEDAVRFGRTDVVRRIGFDKEKDDMTALLAECRMGDSPAVIEMLLEAGADPNGKPGERGVLGKLIEHFAWHTQGHFGYSNLDSTVRCIEVLAHAGVKWRPDKDFHGIRRDLGRAQPSTVIPYLARIVESGAIEQEVFRELMRTPRMKDILKYSSSEGLKLREFADYLPSHSSRRIKMAASRASAKPALA